MSILEILLSAVAIIAIIWLYITFSKSPLKAGKVIEKQTDGVRRKNAKERQPKQFKANLHTTQSGNDERRFFLDVKLGLDGKKFLSISELKKEAGVEIAYTIIVRGYEIEGFRKAFEKSYEFMKNSV